MPSETEHWDEVWASADPEAVSWFQPQSTTSVRLIGEFGGGNKAAVVDVGSGVSSLIGELVSAGYRDIEVLDIAAPALEAVRTKLGQDYGLVFTVANIVSHRFDHTFDVWHDRAVFHFLTTPDERSGYLAAIRSGLRIGGVAVIATFRLGGPQICSGLEVQQYSPETLAEVMIGFELIHSEDEEHTKPNGELQAFQYSVFRRLD